MISSSQAVWDPASFDPVRAVPDLAGDRSRPCGRPGRRADHLSDFSEAPLSVWRAVVIESGCSWNRWVYPAEVLRTAVPLYDGVPMFFNHAPLGLPRSLGAFAGVICRPRFLPYVAGGAVLAEAWIHSFWLHRHLTRRWALDIRASVELSHHATLLSVAADGGRQNVCSIETVVSVDVVTRAAAGGMFLFRLSADDPTRPAPSVRAYLDSSTWSTL